MESLFYRLAKYKSTKDVTPEENFFTEALGYVLDIDKDICKKYIKLLWDDLELDLNEIEDILIETQKRLSYGQPDIQIRFKDSEEKEYLILCEHKISSPVDKDQLRKYTEYLKVAERNSNISGHLVLITKNYVDNEDYIDIKGLHTFTWRDIHEKLKEWQNEVEKDKKLIVHNFVQYMEELGMAKPKKFTALEIAELIHIPKLIKSLDECLKGEAWDEFNLFDGKNYIPPNFPSYPMWLYWRYILNEIQLNIGICLDAEDSRWSDLFEFGDLDYPELIIFLSSPIANELRKKQLEFCRRFADSPYFNSWKTIGKPEKTWMVIVHKSMKDFIHYGDEQIEKIQEWFAGHLRELKEFMKENEVPSES